MVRDFLGTCILSKDLSGVQPGRELMSRSPLIKICGRRAESNGKLPHLFIPSKTENLVPKFSVNDAPFRGTATLVTELGVKDLPLGRTI